jgi:hypothetical protein
MNVFLDIGLCACSLRRTPHGAGMDSGVVSKNETKNYQLSISFSLCSDGAAAHFGHRLLRHSRSSRRLRHRTRVTHGFISTSTYADRLGDDDHNNDHGHDARRRHHDGDRSPARAPAGGCADTAGPKLCMGRRLLDVEQPSVRMDIGTLGDSTKPGCHVGLPALGTTRQCL